jgi:hypothetical protein
MNDLDSARVVQSQSQTHGVIELGGRVTVSSAGTVISPRAVKSHLREMRRGCSNQVFKLLF